MKYEVYVHENKVKFYDCGKAQVSNNEYKLCAAKKVTSGDVSGHMHYALSKKTTIPQTVHVFSICFLSRNTADE